MLAIKRSCRDFILNGAISKDRVMEQVSKEERLSKFTFQTIRQKIIYIRLQIGKKGKTH